MWPPRRLVADVVLIGATDEAMAPFLQTEENKRINELSSNASEHNQFRRPLVIMKLLPVCASARVGAPAYESAHILEETTQTKKATKLRNPLLLISDREEPEPQTNFVPKATGIYQSIPKIVGGLFLLLLLLVSDPTT